MIHSSIDDNWMRVEIMHSVARNYYQATRDSDFRKKIVERRILKRGEPVSFDALQYDEIQKESCIVEMVMVWAVITLESLVNHALAQVINNRTLAITAIEYPKRVTDLIKNTKPRKSELSTKTKQKESQPSTKAKEAESELSMKLAILSDGDVHNEDYRSLADELSGKRNLIVHDKPFNLTDRGDGDVGITEFRLRGDRLDSQLRYEDLGEFFEKCDRIKNYVMSIVSSGAMGIREISFAKLINGKP